MTNEYNLLANFFIRGNKLLTLTTSEAKPSDSASRQRRLAAKFRSSLFKGLRFPKAEPLVAVRRRRNTLCSSKRRRVEKHSSGMFFVGNPRRGFPVWLMLLPKVIKRWTSSTAQEQRMLRASPLKPTKGSAFGIRKLLKKLDQNFYLSWGSALANR